MINLIKGEIFKDVTLDKRYQISNLGRVRRLYKKGYRYRKPVHQNGYINITFSYGNDFKRYQLHRLVALAFLENPLNKPCVNHKDGNKINNELTNLEWCTYSENEKHSHRVLGKITNGIKRRKISIQHVEKIKQLHIEGMMQKDIAKKYNVSNGTICLLINNKTYQKHV